MDFLQEFNKIMENTNEIALATSVNHSPNVRIVNFHYDTQKKGIVYFSTNRDNPKTLEFSQNNKAAFTTVPVGTVEHVRVANATIQKSNLTIYDLKEAFIKKIPSYEVIIAQIGHMLDVYEIHFREASVTLSVNQAGKVTV